jgi:NADH dehydrogenase [ubiquinone] 1 alpha subcomplex assembly factor 5
MQPINLPSSALFDRSLIKERRNRVAPTYAASTPLNERIADDLLFRLQVFGRPFHDIVDLGGHTGQLADRLFQIFQDATIISTDISEAMVRQSSSPLRIVLHEEMLPFAPASLDLVISALSLHWVNDFPGMLHQIHSTLKPGGLFLAAVWGGDTLIELRDCLQTAELELRGGVTPRLSPMIAIKDAGMLLQKAGFSTPVADHDRLSVAYPHPLALLHDLRRMGETNALYHRWANCTPRVIFARAFEIYQERYSLTDGQILATFDAVTMMGGKWMESKMPADRLSL